MTRFPVAALALLLAIAAPLAAAKTIYKLVDRNGRTTYVDTVPKNFDGTVTEMVQDAPITPSAAPPPAPRAQPSTEGKAAPKDINTQRRDARTRLQLALDKARDNLEKAKKALADGGEVMEDEFQVIQTRIAAQKNVPAPRSNCFQQPGAMVWICPVQSPGEKYRDRQKSLEDAVATAEAELTVAEDAFRKGTD